MEDGYVEWTLPRNGLSPEQVEPFKHFVLAVNEVLPTAFESLKALESKIARKRNLRGEHVRQLYGAYIGFESVNDFELKLLTDAQCAVARVDSDNNHLGWIYVDMLERCSPRLQSEMIKPQECFEQRLSRWKFDERHK